MGTAAFWLFTVDKLVALAAKYLALTVTEPAAIKLRQRWEQHQARIEMAQRTKASPDADTAEVLRAYRDSVARELAGRKDEEVFCVQVRHCVN